MSAAPELSAPRAASVAGTFYPAQPARLRDEITALCAPAAAARRECLGVMVPHAGYVYSGGVCGRALASVEVRERVLLLHTRHRAGGGPFSLARHRAWATPLGAVPCDEPLFAALAGLESLTLSDAPHAGEHAAEVVLPFLLALNPGVRVNVISCATPEPAQALELGRGIARALREAGGPVLIVASSDMNHYESHRVTLAKDELALARLRAFDIAGLLEVCEARSISMCGVGATALMLAACRELGARNVEVLEHTTSAAVSGDEDEVVGYASARVW